MTRKNRTTDTAELATVHRLPLEQDVIDGELVSDEEYARLTRQRDQAIARWNGYRSDVVVVVKTARTVATHHHTKAAVRELVFIPIGAWVVARRVWEARTNSRYERMMRAAEAAGNWEELREWESRAVAEKQRRHGRRMDLVELPFRALKAIGAAGGILVGGLVGLGIVLAIADKDIHKVSGPLVTATHLVRDVVTIVGIAWGPIVLAAPWLGMLGLWHVGRRHGGVSWLATAAEADTDLVIDETTIARALGALKIAQINAYLKQGLPLQYITTARADGRGTHAVLRLPAGVTAAQIAKKRAELAGGLHRRAGEVWITTGDEAGVLDLWVADKGALADGAGPYPLLESGTVDVFKGVPFGKTLRGEPLKAPIMGRNTITGGMPDQGKSSVARVIMAGCALDPTTELRIWVPDTNFDFEAFKPRCAEYVMGAEDEHYQRICEGLQDLVLEIQRRGELLVRYQQEQVTRQLASQDVGMHPIVALLEEAHLQFAHRDFGKASAEAAETITRLGRKRGIHLIISTQATTGGSVPTGVTINCSNGICFAVARHQENDAILGQGAYSAGHRATDLIPGVDKGNAVVRGFTGERSAVAQAYYISPSKGRDQVTPIIRRAMAEIERRGKGVPGTGSRREPVKPRDLLEDLAEVLGDEPVPAADLPALLANYAPAWPPYKTMTGKAVRDALARQYGIKVPSTGNRYPVDPAMIRQALAERS